MTNEELLEIIEQAVRDKVTRLNLSGKGLTTLPPEIVQLTNLQSLYLGNNQLSSLPPEIVQLTNLRWLDLWSNQLSSLPPEIVQLTNLYTLDLSSNQLSSLPPEIVQLTNLHTLYLSSNQLSSLPPEIVQLTNLHTLYLGSNQLSSLPPEIVQLTNLRWLDLWSNQLSSLPPEIVQLTNLRSLDLWSNQLSSLPPEFGQLTNLQSLGLGSNPLESPPPEIITKGLRAILDFCRQLLEQKTDLLYEAKLLIVGEAGAGKTTLAKKIKDPNYQLQQNESSTEGINVIQWKFPFKGKEFQVNIWDFGGQEIYHATHQFFLTKRSFYAVVADTRKEDTDFYYWLNVVKLLSDDSPLLIIKNEKQERKREINERELRSEFTNFKETLTTNLATDRGMQEILNTVQHYISNLPHIGTKLPKTWVKVREALERDSHEYITFEKYLNICQEYGFTKEENKLQLSGYLHDLGVCLHFQDDDLLRKTVILKPTWGTDAVYKVLDNPQVIENLGQFDRDDLANIWHEDKYAYMRPELLQLMMKFKLCYKIPSRSSTYIAPQLLSANKPDFTWEKSNNLILRYTYTFMPKGILTRFIVETHPWIEQQKLVWRNGVVLNKDQTRAEIIENYNQREIKIRLAGNYKKELMAVITHEFEKIHNSYERLQYETLVPCNCQTCENLPTPYSYSLDKLKKRLDAKRYQIQCENSYEMVDIRRLIDDVMFQSAEADEESNAKVAQLQNELERKRDESLTHRLQDSSQEEKPIMNSQSVMEFEKEIFISYAWGGESEQFVNQLDETLQAKEIKIIRDKRDLGYKGLIKAFMERIGRGKCAIAVISDKYLKSPNCMFELVQIAKNGEFGDRIFPIVLPDAQIYDAIDRLKYVEYWENKVQELDAALKKVSAANLDGFREDIDLYAEIRQYLPRLANILKDMNTLTPDIHSKSEFESLLNAIAQRLDE